MTKYSLSPLRPELVVCPNPACGASARIGVHSHQERRYKCHACGGTFAETVGTPFYGLKHPTWLVVLVLTLLAYGCPIPAIVAALTLDERTVADWHQKAGQHAKHVQEHLVCQGQGDLGQVQGDELYVKTQRGTVWMATAMCVFSRLFVWGAVAPTRDTALITQVVQHVRAAARRGQPILWAVDGFAAWTSAILQVFRDPVRTGKRGRPPLVVWAELHIVQVIKRRTGRRLTAVERRLAHGCLRCAETIMQATQVGLGVINTAYIERLNATFRTWLPALTRRSRTPAREVARLEAAMFWMGAVYNFCRVHTTLQGSPAMAADLTDHVWSVDELLRYRPKRE
jgi:transposase-like protein